MTIKRLDHVSVVVDDLAAAIAFFTALGVTLEGETPVGGAAHDGPIGQSPAGANPVAVLSAG